jgi:hypothetical protein
MQKSRVNNPRYLEKYFTQFPNIIDDSELDPYEFRLLLHYYRVGECWEGVRKTATICKMSTGKVASTRKALEEKGFITIAMNGDGIIINLVDLAQKNLNKYSKSGVHVVDTSVHGMDRGVHVVDSERSQGEHKNNTVKNTIPSNDGDLFQNGGISSDSETSEHSKTQPPVNPPKADECYKPFSDAWHAAYPSLGFNATTGKMIKQMIKETKAILTENQKDVTTEAAVNLFKYILAYVARVNHFYHMKAITSFASHYREIYTEIKHGKQKSLTGQNSSAVFSKYSNLM